MIQGMRNLPYKDRLNRLNLHSLERRRARKDIIEVYKWVKGINKGNIDQVVEINSPAVLMFLCSNDRDVPLESQRGRKRPKVHGGSRHAAA